MIKSIIAALVLGVVLFAIEPAIFTLAIPSEVQMPGTQPGEVNNLGLPSQCDNCHAGYDPAVEPARTWRQSMMAHAGRDPLFWAAVAVTDQTFAGAGDLCLRCHAPRGWTEGRSSPTDGSGLAASDDNGVECAICHKMVNPDGSEHVGVQNAPYVANDGGIPASGYYGSGMMVLRSGNHRLGPYADATAAPHAFLQSQFHRTSEFCGTCHDVSNPLVGDLAHNNGAPVPLPPGSFVGTLGGNLADKAAFQNFPYQYGVVERTFSEHRASLLSTTPTSAFGQLPQDLQGGAIAAAWNASLLAGQGGDYADGTTRFFTCQSCHNRPVVGKGAAQSDAPIRTDLPSHDMIGGNYWIADAIEYLAAQNALPLGNGLTADEIAGINEGQTKARAQLDLAAALQVQGNVVRVVNRTGHKLITGYPEGRRMWLNVKWYGATGTLLREDGAYGTISASLPNGPVSVATILDLSASNTRIWQAKFGITQQWAAELVASGVPSTLVLSYDRVTSAPGMTLGQLAGMAPGASHETFHFGLNNVLLDDNRIPPYGMERDAAQARNILPVPPTLFGNPGPGGTYDYWDDVPLSPPAGSQSATVSLLYQPTSWEYVQFLRLANSGTGFLGATGTQMLDAWLQTGMAAPHVMAQATWTPSCGTAASWSNYGAGWPGTLGIPVVALSANPILGTTVHITIGNSAGAPTPAALVVGPSPAFIPTTIGGTLLVTPDSYEIVVLPAPALMMPLVLPADPSACGVQFFGQVIEGDPGASAGYSFSPGIHVVLGN